MKILTLRQQSKPREYSLILDTFKGTATVLDDAIAGKEYAKQALNLIQVQDGRWKNRWGREVFGQAITGETELMGTWQFVKVDGTRELVAIGKSGTAYKSQDGGAWTSISGATFDITAKNYFFKQINNYLFICNGVDRLTRYNGTVLSRYTALTTPVGLGGTRGAGLTTGTFNNYYRVTALNDIGETIGSTEYSIPTNKERIVWNTASNEYIDLTWTATAGATKYQVYYSNITMKEELLTDVTTNAYKDDNTSTPNPFVVVPEQDSTGAPKFSMVATSGSRIWGIAPSEYKWRVFFSGTGQYLGYFGYTFGGGWIDLDSGSAEEVAFIEHYRTGKGDTAATVFTKDPRGGGSVWQVSILSMDVAGTTILIPNPDKIVGSIGTNSPGAAVLVGDTIMFLSAYGVITLSNKQNVVNVLSTTEQSRDIQPSYIGLNFAVSDQFRAYQYRNFTFFSATEGTGANDRIFIRDTDLDRWYWYWNFGVKQFFEYTDNAGKTYFLYTPTSGNQLVQISENIRGDFGDPFSTSLLTGLIPIDRDKYVFAKVGEALIDLGRPKGTINFEVLGTERKKGFQALATKQITDSTQANEFWTGSLGEITLKDEEDAPTTYSQASVRKRKRVGKTLNNIQFHVYSNDMEAEYTVLSIQAKGIIEDVKPPSSWN
jgi:hypothetical protein